MVKKERRRRGEERDGEGSRNDNKNDGGSGWSGVEKRGGEENDNKMKMKKKFGKNGENYGRKDQN